MTEAADMVIRPATLADSRAIFDIRYHPAINFSPAARDQREVPFEEHDAWFQKKYCSEAANYCFFAFIKGKAGAYCRLDQQATGEFEVSLIILPEYQGQGLGGQLLEVALKSLAAGTRVRAVISRANENSWHFFSKHGFKRIDSEGNYERYEKIV